MSTKLVFLLTSLSVLALLAGAALVQHPAAQVIDQALLLAHGLGQMLQFALVVTASTVAMFLLLVLAFAAAFIAAMGLKDALAVFGSLATRPMRRIRGGWQRLHLATGPRVRSL